MVYKLWTVLPYSVSLHVLLRCLSGCIVAGGRISRADCKTPQNLPCRSLDIGNTPTIKTCMSVLSDNSLLLIKLFYIATIRPLKEGKRFSPSTLWPTQLCVIVDRLRILTISIDTQVACQQALRLAISGLRDNSLSVLTCVLNNETLPSLNDPLRASLSV